MPSSTKSSFGYLPQYAGVTNQGLAESGAPVSPVAVKVDDVSASGDVQYTAANLMNGFICHDPSGGPGNAKMPTASDFLMAIGGQVVGASKDFVLKNTADASETITIQSADAKFVLNSGRHLDR